MDCVVKSWISGTISSDLAKAVMGRDATARDVWLALEDQFLGNQETRALHLDAKFRHFCQGELSITDYCRRFKNMADSLGDLGEPVTDRTLVLNVIRGLADRFHDVGRHLRLSRDFPTFLEVRSALILEELTMDQRASTPSTALLASDDKQPAGSTSSSSRRPPAQQQQQPGAGTRGSSQQQQRPPSNRRSKRAGKGTQQRGSTSPATPAAPPSVASSGGSGGPWPSPQHPWSGAIHMWPGQQAPSLTPPQQQALLAQQQAYLVQQAQQQAAYANPAALAQHQALLAHQQAVQNNTYPPVQGWDQHSLASAFSTVSLNQPQNTDWYFDSGATSHMTSDAGILSSTSPPGFSSPCFVTFFTS
jgi:hypothetical protein